MTPRTSITRLLRGCIPIKPLRFFLRRQVEGYCLMFEAAFVGAVAERLIVRQAATAQRYHCAASEIINVALLVYYFEIALYFVGAVAVDRYPCCHVGDLISGECSDYHVENGRLMQTPKMAAAWHKYPVDIATFIIHSLKGTSDLLCTAIQRYSC